MIAIVLIQTETRNVFSDCTEIRKIEGVDIAHVVTGQNDLVAVIDTTCVNLRCLVAAIHDAKGVKRTETCIAVS